MFLPEQHADEDRLSRAVRTDQPHPFSVPDGFVDLIEVDTRESYMRPLMRFFRLREKRRREGR